MVAKKKYPEATQDQLNAWKYYGIPSTAQASSGSANPPSSRRVGEVRYIIGWMADQMVRMGWRITMSGSEDWKITGSDGRKITSNSQETDLEKETHPVNASRKLLESIEWDSRTVREVTTNLFVAGELHYALDGERWRVVSVIRSGRQDILERSRPVIRGLWPHPADPEAPDAPLFGVLNVLDDIFWLNRLSRSQSANRVGMRGILGIADSFESSSGGKGDAFWEDLQSAMARAMDDPEDVSPVAIIGSKDLVRPKDSGMEGMSWVIPDFPYDDKVDERTESLVRRLAYGLPVPPEVLLGLQAQSKATAFQVEGSTYRAHIEPVAFLVARIATDALRQLIDSEQDSLEVVPDPTAILARRHSVSDVLEAHDRGAANYEYLREVLGIPARAAFTEEDIAFRREIQYRTANNKGVDNPEADAASEPVMGASEPQPTEVDEWLSDRLHQIDTMAFYELVGATSQALSRAREKIGAKLRSDKNLREQIPKELSNEEVTDSLKGKLFDLLDATDLQRIIADATEPTLKWWEGRVLKAREEVATVLDLGDIEASFEKAGIRRSSEVLFDTLTDAITEGRDVPEGELRKVTEEAGR